MFDLFHTLLVPTAAMLPEVRLADGSSVRTTAPLLLPTVRRWRSGIDVAALAAAQWDGWQRAERLRREEMRETHAADRFAWTLAALDVSEPERRASELLAVHRAALLDATDVPPTHVGLVAALRLSGYRVGLITNYDDPEGAEILLRDTGLAEHLEAVVVSGAEGRVKPHAALFERALKTLEVAPRDAWYVGDTYETDVVGAAAAGLVPIWLCANGPLEHASAEAGGVWTVRALADLVDLLLD